jgi:hypothetical protein
MVFDALVYKEKMNRKHGICKQDVIEHINTPGVHNEIKRMVEATLIKEAKRSEDFAEWLRAVYPRFVLENGAAKIIVRKCDLTNTDEKMSRANEFLTRKFNFEATRHLMKYKRLQKTKERAEAVRKEKLSKPLKQEPVVQIGIKAVDLKITVLSREERIAAYQAKKALAQSKHKQAKNC